MSVRVCCDAVILGCVVLCCWRTPQWQQGSMSTKAVAEQILNVQNKNSSCSVDSIPNNINNIPNSVERIPNNCDCCEIVAVNFILIPHLHFFMTGFAPLTFRGCQSSPSQCSMSRTCAHCRSSPWLLTLRCSCLVV